MSFKIEIKHKKALIYFNNEVQENEIKNAFIELTEQINIKELTAIILDFSAISSYTIPPNYLETLKMITLFSETWNAKIKVAVIATHINIRTVVAEIIKRSAEFKWEYNLFEESAAALAWLKQS